MFKSTFALVCLVAVAILVSACGATPPTNGQPTSGTVKLSGTVTADGSSTVFPISEAVAEEFRSQQPDVKVTVGTSGTGGGFKKFCNGEIDISNASRAIQDSEKQACANGGIEYTEFLIGLDGLTVVVNRANNFAECLKVEQLKAIWNKDSRVKNWKEVDPSFPDQPLTLYGPGTDSGTFDFFTEVVNGKAKESRSDYTASEDDNVLVQGVSGDQNALGYFGLAYFLENENKLKPVAIDGSKGCVEPSFETVSNKTYTPLSRPLYIYAKNASLARPEVHEFVKFYLTVAPTVVPEVGYVTLQPAEYQKGLDALAKFSK